MHSKVKNIWRSLYCIIHPLCDFWWFGDVFYIFKLSFRENHLYISWKNVCLSNFSNSWKPETPKYLDPSTISLKTLSKQINSWSQVILGFWWKNKIIKKLIFNSHFMHYKVNFFFLIFENLSTNLIHKSGWLTINWI
jgi:hypothetical protein